MALARAVSLPLAVLGDQGVCKNDQFSHDGCQGNLRIFPPPDQIPIGLSKEIRSPDTGDGAHVQRVADAPSATPDLAVAVPSAAVPVHGRDTGKSRYFPGVCLAEFGQIGNQDGCRDAPNAGNGGQNLKFVSELGIDVGTCSLALEG